MGVFNGFFALGTGVTNFGVFSEVTGYTRPAVSLTGTATGGLTQALGAITGITGPSGNAIRYGAIFDAITGGNCLCRWHWTLATRIPATFAAIVVNVSFNSSTSTQLNLSAIGGSGTSGTTIDQGADIGTVNDSPFVAATRLSIQAGTLVALSTVPPASSALLPQIVTSGSALTMAGTLMLVNKTVGSATAVTLSPGSLPWVIYAIKDKKGDAATNNITVSPPSGLIDGSSSFLINVNFMSVSFVFDGSNWSVV